jgi:hypothetical protein
MKTTAYSTERYRQSVKYKFQGRYEKWRSTLLLKKCAGKTVVHLGAADHANAYRKELDEHFLHSTIHKVSKRCLGVDYDKHACAEITANFGYEFQVADITKSIDLPFEPEVVLLPETIEHITNLDGMFRTLRSIVNDDCELIVTTPNALFLVNTLTALLGVEVCHPDHKMSYTTATLCQLLDDQGFEVSSIHFTNIEKGRGPDMLFLKVLRNTIFRLFPWFSESIFVVAKKKI